MTKSDYLYMIHDILEMQDEETNKELAGLLDSFDRLPECGKEHRTALRLFAATLAQRVQSDREARHEHSEAAAEALRERVEDE